MDARPVILLIDDDGPFIESVLEFFPARGYRVEVARSAIEALGRAAHINPQLVITDMLLPGRSGFHVTEQLRGRDRALTIIMAASFGNGAQRRLALFLGADEFIRKPVSMNRLLESVRRRCPAGLQGPHSTAWRQEVSAAEGG